MQTLCGRLGLMLLGLGVLLANTGCNIITAATILLAPEQKQDAMFELTTSRLAVVVDDRSGDAHPLFERAFYEKFEELLEANEINDRVVPYREYLGLKEQHRAEYHTWALQRIARELDADQLVAVEIERLQLRESPAHPMLSPQVNVYVKVIDGNLLGPDGRARLWPDDQAGYALEVKREVREARNTAVIDSEARKLGKDLAQYVSRIFFEHSVEERIPVEP